MIQFQNVTKLYKSVIGVNDLTLDIANGAYGLLGPNGSGKTTLINLILGQLRPTIGQVLVFGQNPWLNQSSLHKIGYCPAIEPMFPAVTGLQWTTYLVQLHGFTRFDALNRAKNMLEQVGMGPAMNRNMGGYSLGMRQRCKLAQSMAHDPELLILDEPFNGLDPVGRFEMTAYLKKWVSDGRSLILASHILHEVEAVNPSLLLISGGRMLASGSPEEVREILADCPNAIFIRTSDNHLLAGEIAKMGGIENIMFEHEKNAMIITTPSAATFLRSIVEIVEELGLDVFEIRPADESLQDIFSTLMRMHRGEMHQRRDSKSGDLKLNDAKPV